jgi:hypothetical protein
MAQISLERNYTLSINFTGEYEARNAITAIELCVPENHHNVFDPDTLDPIAIEIWNACFRDKKSSRPAIMPHRFESVNERNTWLRISERLIEAGKYIESYVKELDADE